MNRRYIVIGVIAVLLIIAISVFLVTQDNDEPSDSKNNETSQESDPAVILAQTLRDTERRDVVNALNLWLTDYYVDNFEYPATSEIRFTGTAIEYSGTNPATKVLDLADATSSAEASDENGTSYCYESTGDYQTFRLGVRLEDGANLQLGNDSVDCEV